MSSYPETKRLLRELRSASLNRNDEAAFAILEQLTKLDPGNENHRRQKKEVGQRLCNQYRDAIAEISRQSDLIPVRQLLDKIRHLADEDYLQRFEGYAALASRAEAAIKQQHQQELRHILQALSNENDLVERAKQARRAEEFAQKHLLTLKPTEEELLNTTRQKWRQAEDQRQREEEGAALLAELENLHRHYKSNRADLSHEELTEILSRLAEIRAQEERLPGDMTENDRCARTAHLQEQIRKELLLRHRRQILQKVIPVTCTGLLLGGMGLTGYCYTTASKAANELLSIRQQRQVALARETCTSGSILPAIYKRINSRYAAEYRQLQQWYNQWLRILRDSKRTLAQLEKNTPPGVEQLDTYLESVNKLASLLTEAKQKFSAEIPDITPGKCAELMLPIRKSLSKLFQDTETHLDQLSIADLAQKLRQMRRIRYFLNAYNCDEEPQLQPMIDRVENTLHERLDELSHQSPEEALKQYSSFCKELELPQEWSEPWQKALSERRTQAQKRLELRQCKTLDQYIQLAQELVNTGTNRNFCSVETLQRIREEGENAIVLYRIEQLSNTVVLPWGTNDTPSDILQQLRHASEVYSGKTPLYAGRYTIDLSNRVKQLFTRIFPNNKKLVLVKQQDNEYVGSYSYMGKIWMRFLFMNTQGKLSGEEQDFGTYPLKEAEWTPVDAEISPEKMLISRSDMERGTLLPDDMLKRIANYRDSACPTYVKCYLFRLAIDWLHALEKPLLTGEAFSPALRADIAAFNKLARGKNLQHGCWYESHKMKDTKQWKHFFDQVAGRSYRSEIRDNLRKLTRVQHHFVGYIDEDKQLQLTTPTNRQLCYFRHINGQLQFLPLLSGETPAPYTPIFILP